MDNKAAIREWAIRMHNEGAVCLDTECTGGSFQDEVIEVGVVRARDGLILFDSQFKPDTKINWFAAKKHGMFKKHLKDKPKFFEHWDELYSVLKDRPVLAYNSAFDKRAIDQSCVRYGIEISKLDWQCIMNKLTLLNGKKISLDKACEMFKIQNGNHRAVNDALAAARVVWKLTRI